jgi:transcription-repair coupling factor (superfamily II helicase)
MESLAPALVDGMESVLDTLREGTAVVVCDPERVRTRAHDLVATSQEFLEAGWANAASGNAVPIDLEGMFGTASFWGLADLRAHARDGGMPWWDLGPFVADEELADDDSAVVNSGLEEAPRYRGSTPEAVSDLRGWVADGWRVVVVTEGHGLARRVAEVLADESVPARLDADLTDLAPGMVHLTSGSVGAGFVSAASRFALITETDLTGTPGQGGSTKDMRKMPSKRRNQVDPLQLRPGDFVVHEQHGVGRFVEMVQRKIGDATREYLVLEYAPGRRGQPGDRLFVPTDQLDQVTRYLGGEQPTLNKMGGSDSQKTKGRARKYVKQIAAELIQLYSARMATSGFAFGADTPWQRELEDAFVYVETPDQLSSIDEVKADMERTVPMDRLTCGDVGYGKTEIAVRAAFKAIQDGKQVAVLVPTTLLVQQHFQSIPSATPSSP